MKKILVVLLILSVAWGVFAQDGSWRLSGNVEIGTRLDFYPYAWDKSDTRDGDALAGGITYNHWDANRGRFALIYGTFVNDGALSTGLKLNTRAGGAENEPFFSYNGENFSFSTAMYGNMLFVSGSGQDAGSLSDSDAYIKRLWGNYKFINGIVFLEIAFRGEEQEFWISDTTAGGTRLGTIFGLGGDGSPAAAGAGRGTDKIYNAGFFGKPSTFTYTDSGGADYLLAQLNLDAISFGFMIPQLFGGRYNYYTGYGGNYGPYDQPWHRTSRGKLVDDVLKESIFGVKFSMAPIEFAGQFKMKSAGAYIGAKFFAGPVTVGASFSGLFNPEKDDSGAYLETKFFKVGGDLGFNGGVFTAGVAASLERDSVPDDSKSYNQFLRIQPRFSYNVIPSHLCFALDAGFYFYSQTGVKATVNVGEKDSDITWVVQPALFWTFLGTGARNGYGWTGPFYQGGPTGFIARYRVASAGADWRTVGGGLGGGNPIQLGAWMQMNALDLIFQFNF